MSVLGSLSNRIFLASALLAVLSIGVAIWLINHTVTLQLERETLRSLDEAGTLVDEYRRMSVSQLGQSARLIADLPKFKAAVELSHPPTVAPLATDYRRQLSADLLVVVGRDGRVLAEDAARGQPALAPAERAQLGLALALDGSQSTALLPRDDGILQLVTVPVWIDAGAPDVLGALAVGIALDQRFAVQIKQLTASDIAFGWGGRVRATTIQRAHASGVEPLLRTRENGQVFIGDEAYDAIVRPLAVAEPLTARSMAALPPAEGAVVVLRSRTERLRPLRSLHAALALTAVVAVLLATVLSYLVARTVTRPVGAITAAMRDMATSGDLTPRPALAPGSRWGDDDARVLADTFNAMTTSIARFQREASLRERLSSLGRLSTVIAHEVRNPLMIIRTALRSLRRLESRDEQVATAVADIDEEVTRLDRVVNEVLDFARPMTFDLAPARLSAICRDAVAATDADGARVACCMQLDPEADEIATDAERLRQALVNVLANARQAVSTAEAAADRAHAAARHGAPPSPPRVMLRTEAAGDRVRLVIIDEGPGVDGRTLARMFEPFFTTRATGTGIGLAITKNIIEGLGGVIHATSTPGTGTEITIELPRAAAVRGIRS